MKNKVFLNLPFYIENFINDFIFNTDLAPLSVRIHLHYKFTNNVKKNFITKEMEFIDFTEVIKLFIDNKILSEIEAERLFREFCSFLDLSARNERTFLSFIHLYNWVYCNFLIYLIILNKNQELINIYSDYLITLNIRYEVDQGINLLRDKVSSKDEITRHYDNLIKQPPPHPGQILLNDFLKGDYKKYFELGEACKMPPVIIQRILDHKKDITPLIAFKLAYVLETSPEFWLNLQSNYDLYLVYKDHPEEVKKIGIF